MAIKEILFALFFLNVSVVPSIFSEIRQDTARVEQHKKATIISLDKDQSDTKGTQNLSRLGWVPEKPGFHRKSLSPSRAITTQFPQKFLALRTKQTEDFVGATMLRFIQLHLFIAMERVCSKRAPRTETLPRKEIFLLDCWRLCLPIGDDERCDKNVLTFVIVIPFRPICCHETAQSATHVPTARPFIDLEQPGMIAKRLRRKVFGNFCIGREGKVR